MRQSMWLPLCVLSHALCPRAQQLQLLFLSLWGTALAEEGTASEASCQIGEENPRCVSTGAAGDIASKIPGEASTWGPLRWRGFPYYVSHPKFARTIYGGAYISATFKDYGFEGSVDDDTWDVLWTHRPQYQGLANIVLPQRPGVRLANHCNYFGGAGNKCQLAHHVRKIMASNQKDDPPRSPYHMTRDSVPPELARHLRTFDLSKTQDLQAWQNLVRKNSSQNWILKPCLGGASKGIEVLHGQALLDATSSAGFLRETVAQEYVEHPFLGFGSSKFHLRLYVLATSWAPSTAYLYDDGLVFRSRHAYQHDSSRSASADAFSSISEDVEVLPLVELWEHLDSLAQASSQAGSAEVLAPDAAVVRARVSKVLAETLGSGLLESFGNFQALEKERGFSCFDLFGVDVILDKDLWPYVMEINVGPDLWVSHRGDAHVAKQESVKVPLIQQVVHWTSLRVRSGESAQEAERLALKNFQRLL